jgi:hypothetical protein
VIPAVLAAVGEAAGAVGGAEAAGSLGALGGQMQACATQAKGLLGQIKDLVNPFRQLESAAHKLYDGVNFLPRKILEVEAMIVSTGQNLVHALAAPIDTIRQLGDAVGAFVRFANPASVTMFQYRVENAFATIGNILQPVFDALSRAAVTVGDTFARLKPAFEPAMMATAKLIDMLVERFADFAELLAPGIQMVSSLFLALAQVLEMIERPITLVLRAFNKLRAELYDLLGIPTGFNRDAKADIAVRPPRYTSAEEMQREMARNALMSSANAGDRPRDEKGFLEQILKWLQENLNKDTIKAIVEFILDRGKEKLKENAGGGAARAGAGVGYEIGRAWKTES